MNANAPIPQSAAVPAVPALFEPKIVEYSLTAASLAELEQRYGKTVFNVATTTGMKEAKAGRRELRDMRTQLEATRVAVKAPSLERCRLIDEEAKVIDGILEGLFKPLDVIIKAEEARKEAERIENERKEQMRIAAIQSAIADIRNLPASVVGKTAAEILRMAEEADAMHIDPNFYGGYANEASIARNAAAANLRKAHSAQLAQEAEQTRLIAERAELARLRAEQEAREAAERIEREAREAAERKARAEQEELAHKERERQEAQMRAQREELDRQAAELERQRAEMEEQKKATEAAAQKLVEAAKPAPVIAPSPVPAPAQVESVPAEHPQLGRARAELEQFRATYGDISELADVVVAIDKFLGN